MCIKEELNSTIHHLINIQCSIIFYIFQNLTKNITQIQGTYIDQFNSKQII